MNLLKSKHNTIYTVFFSSFLKFSIIITLVIFVIFYSIISYMALYIYSQNALSSVKSKSDNASFVFQEDINLCRSLAENNTLIQTLLAFKEGNIYEKIDAELRINELFENYWYSHNEIADIRIFLPVDEKPESVAFSTIRHLSLYADTSWIEHFSPEAPAIVTEHSASNKLHLKFDTERMAIIYPIVIDNSFTPGYICMDISKSGLYKKMQNDSDSQAPVFVFNNLGEIILSSSYYNSNPPTVDDSWLYPSSSGYTTTQYNNQKYLLFYSDTNHHGWKTVMLLPYYQKTTIILLLTAAFILTLLAFALLLVHHSKTKSRFFAQPLSALSDAMNRAAPIETDNTMAIELQNVFSTYNHLLENNSRLLIQAEAAAQKQRKSEIKMLLAQISPHFLYNTLNSIAWEAMSANQPKICSSISKLAKLFKLSYSFDLEYTSLQHELDHIQLYMELQKECFKDKFDYSINVADELINFEIPRFILQPLVENAIIHGFSQIDRMGHLTVSAEADIDLVITVSDNGSGIEKSILQKLNSNNYFSEKYGIRNINQRIKLMCGEEYGIAFSSNGYNKTSVTVTLPIKILSDTTDERI